MGERVGRWPLLPALTAAVWGILVVVLTVKNVIAPHEHTLFPLYSQTAHQAWGDISFEPSPFGPSPFGKQYLPYFADLVAPFAYLPEPVGATLWSLLSLAIFITGMLRFFPLAGRQVLSANVWSVLLLAVPWLGLESLNNGQANVLNAGCLLWGAVLVARERWWLAALCLALPGFKIYPLALGLLLSALFPRLTPRFILAVLATLLLPFLLHPAERVWSGYANVFEYIRGGSHYVAYNFIDLRSFLEKCGLRIGPRPFLIVQAASGAVCLGAVWSMKRRGADAAACRAGAGLDVAAEFSPRLLVASGWRASRTVHRRTDADVNVWRHNAEVCGQPQARLPGSDSALRLAIADRVPLATGSDDRIAAAVGASGVSSNSYFSFSSFSNVRFKIGYCRQSR